VDVRIGIDGLADDLAEHLVLIGEASPVYTQAVHELTALLCGATANRAIVARLERAWRQRSFRAAYERPLLLLAALRHDALVTGPEHPLARALADEHPHPGAVDRAALTRALDPDRLPIWLALATRRVQTNDVSRAVAWRWPAALAGKRPIALVDVGCSAGLNLVADALAAPWVDSHGARLPVDGGPVVARLGFDAAPIELGPGHEDEAVWLRACIWPGDVDRLRRLDAAIEALALARVGAHPPRIEQVRARLVPGRLRRLDREQPPATLLLIVQSFVREYIEHDEAADYELEMRTWLAALPSGRAVWMQLELARDGRLPPAELVAVGPGMPRLSLARCGYHPVAMEPQPDAVAELRAVLVGRH
jgi:hypothetical protein